MNKQKERIVYLNVNDEKADEKFLKILKELEKDRNLIVTIIEKEEDEEEPEFDSAP